MDGNYGDYCTKVKINGAISTFCDCQYPGDGCKHVVAVLLDILDRTESQASLAEQPQAEDAPFLSPEEIKQQALADRQKKAAKELFTVTQGDMFKGDQLLETPKRRQYQVTLHNDAGIGHCSCPDFRINALRTCKHLIFLVDHFRKQKMFVAQIKREKFPYVDIFWDAAMARPRLFHEQSADRLGELGPLLDRFFDSTGLYRGPNNAAFMPHLPELSAFKQVRIQETVLQKISNAVLDEELTRAAGMPLPDLAPLLKVAPYPYQEEGMRFALYKKAALIGDEMGLGKTMQAIGLGVLKRRFLVSPKSWWLP